MNEEQSPTEPDLSCSKCEGSGYDVFLPGEGPPDCGYCNGTGKAT